MFRCSTFFFLCQHWHRNSKRIACDIHRMCVFFSCWQNRDPSRNITWKYKSNSAKFSEHDKFNYCHCTTYTRQATSPYISDSLCSVWCTECPRSTISFVSESFWSVWWIKCPRSQLSLSVAMSSETLLYREWTRRSDTFLCRRNILFLLSVLNLRDPSSLSSRVSTRHFGSWST